jgi:transglutaminase-like putative cysteine protease
MNYTVRHTTTYSYKDPVALCQNQIHLTPRTTPYQSCANFRLEISPEPIVRRSWTDVFGNEVWSFSIEEPHQKLEVTGRSQVTVMPHDTPAPTMTPAWEDVRDELDQAASFDARLAAQFCFESSYIRYLQEALDYAAVSFMPERPILDAALDLTSRIYHDFKYVPASTAVTTTTSEVFKSRRGVCQDFAHLQITCLRSLGLAARYVSGYLMTDPPPGQQKLIGSDASHAWLSIYCPGTGWIDLDPTNNVIPKIRHVTLAWGRDYGDVSPIQGVFTGGGKHEMHVAVDVLPLQAIPEPIGA